MTPRTGLRASLVVAVGFAIAPGSAPAETPTAQAVLKFVPTMRNVEFETPDPEGAKACKVEPVLNAQKKAIGWALRDGQGKLLRRFVVAHKSKQMDQWSYYQDGFEVYRETDLDNDAVPDECRWMNGGGTRVASVSQGKVTGWKRISAEEASKVLVQGLASFYGPGPVDMGLVDSVMATPKELTALGVPQVEVDQVAAAEAKRAEQVQALSKALVGWNKTTAWNRFDCAMPHLIPIDPVSGVTHDLLLYENALIFAGVTSPGAAAANAKVSFLQAPEVIQVGDCWKFVSLPRAIDPEKPNMAAEGGLRGAIFRNQGGGGGPENAEGDGALRSLAEYDNANAKVLAEGDKKAIAQFHVGRIPKLREAVRTRTDGEEKLVYEKQVVDSLAAAYQTGFYPNGLTLLNKLAKGEVKIAPFAAFRAIGADFGLKNDEPGANLMANQKAWLSDLKGFLTAYPKADEVPEALMQLANVNEYNAEEDEARKYYNQLVHDYPGSEPAKKAAGAVKRLDLVGKAIDLKGPGLGGEEINLAKYRGKTVLVAFWASWADPVRRDLPELLKVYKKYHEKDFELVGVDLDNTRAELDAFLKENSLPWTQIYEPGGVEKNRLAVEYGIISLPTMILVDAQGKVVNRNIRSPAELERQLEKLINGTQPGVALDR